MDSFRDGPRLLVIDSYDSFTNNLACLIKRAIPSSLIFIIKNDDLDFERLKLFLPYFSAVLVGPGPGSPTNRSDVGVVGDLWGMSQDVQLPVFGVCLGLQSLGIAFGGSVRRLSVVKHGQISQIVHNGDTLFDAIPQASSVVRYHSLRIDLDGSSKLAELAWADDGNENGRVTMGLKHQIKPFYAVQYHPESVCTDGSGIQLIRNFWRLACDWSFKNERTIKEWDGRAEKVFSYNAWPLRRTSGPSQPKFTPQRVTFSKLSLPQLRVPQICEILGVYKANTDFVLLDSAAEPGSHSIVGCIHPNSVKVQYLVGDDFVTVLQGKQRTTCALGSSDVWTWLAAFMRTKEAIGGDPSVPFWGGFVGYLSYELGVDTVHPELRRSFKGKELSPDVNLVFIERSLVVHAKTGEVTIQSLVSRDDDWFAFVASALKRAAAGEETARRSQVPRRPMSGSQARVTFPDKSKYISRIREAQGFLFSGESYELCLTARTRLLVPKAPGPSSQSSWETYKTLRTANPAPYAAYLRLYPTTLISSSPERFLSYSRSPYQRFQLRPIKGTVRKGNGVTREQAEEILSSPKEIGENLMIVDLIRHDLHGVVGTNVDVRRFCGIEEYETVWQLVSVIEGATTPLSGSDKDEPSCSDELGWEVLRKALPPGSMTGAPKKRSVQILQDLEDERRGIYSGVVGYWCVGGGGDWSVIIRSCFKHEGARSTGAQQESTEGIMAYDEWLVGAGGAITALSDPEAEWDEMVTKLQSVLRAFRTDE